VGEELASPTLIMKKIKTINIKNFQCWKSASLNLDKCLNVITGSSDSGKSSLMRAICAPLTGEFDSDWINFDAKEAYVELVFEDGTKAKRTRSKKENSVSFTDVQGKESTWERIGASLPQEYVEKLGDVNVKIDDSFEISPCLHLQHDGHFFISLSDQQKSKLIGSISGVFVVDDLLAKIHTEVRDLNKENKFNLQKIEEIEFSLTEQKTNYEKVSSVFKSVKLLGEFLKIKNNKLINLEGLKHSFEKSQSDFSTNSENLAFVEKILSNCKIENLERLEKLYNVYCKHKKIESDFKINNDKLQKVLKSLDFGDFSKEAEIKLSKMLQLKIKFSELSEKTKSIENSIFKLDDELLSEKSKIKICPVCGAEKAI
jgi:exonuclease SbcC